MCVEEDSGFGRGGWWVVEEYINQAGRGRSGQERVYLGTSEGSTGGGQYELSVHATYPQKSYSSTL